MEQRHGGDCAEGHRGGDRGGPSVAREHHRGQGDREGQQQDRCEIDQEVDDEDPGQGAEGFAAAQQ
ncbi:hypothetical protein [Streptomyces gilvus]|uniref:hypothetical protein n=1 Tax=Streptomyces gilvus TaxID=2920937 RepID=UPI001F0E7509|nr:hypothetical protein [Streptomyces sp. CME 23]MCH5676858.1 hypothetical protein [Streptomyces sp. CME 23]